MTAASESRQRYIYTRVPDGIEEAESYIAAALRERDNGHRMPFVTLWHDRVVGCTSYLDLQQWRWPVGSPLSIRNSAYYSIVRAEWPAIRAKLAEALGGKPW